MSFDPDTHRRPTDLSGAGAREREDELVARVRVGDERAFEAIFTTYFASLCSFIRGYMPTADHAEELIQDVFLRIWQHRAEWRPSSVRAYLFGAARNSAINHLRHERIVVRLEEAAAREELAVGLGCPPVQPDVAAQANDVADALRRAVQAMPERRRQVVILRWEHQMSQAEIAQVLGVSVRTVETQFGRAMAFLRQRLAPFRG